MSPSRSLAVSLILLGGIGTATLLGGCGDDDGGGTTIVVPDDPSILMQALADSLANIPDDASRDHVRNLRYPEIRAGFESVLAADAGNAIAHLGLGILEVLEINYSAELWDFIEDFIDYEEAYEWPGDGGLPVSPGGGGGIFFRPGSPILGNQFTLLATAPRELARQSVRTIPANLTAARFQELVETVVIPALDRSVAHLAQAEAGGPIMTIQVEDETDEIDVGEVYFFHAAVVAARAGFRIATAYDFGLPGPDGTYGWLDDIPRIDRCDAGGYFEEIGATGNYRAVRIRAEGRNASNAAAESSLVAVIQWNLESRSAFLARRNNGMTFALEDLRTVRDLVQTAVTSIRAETDSQVDDVIRIVDLVDVDSDIADPTWDNRPVFAENFTTIEDVLAWVDEVLTGRYEVVDENGPNGPITFSVNLAAFLTTPPDDWKPLLPSHKFEPTASWIGTPEYQYSYYDFPPFGTSISVWNCVTGSWDTRTDVTEVRTDYFRIPFEPLKLYDGPNGTGSPISGNTVPHLPDPTMGGLFPDATQAKWQEIADNAGW